MKTQALIDALAARSATLRAEIAPLAKHNTLTPRFDKRLFNTRSTEMDACLQEVNHNIDLLRQYADAGQTDQVAWLAERIVNQMAALGREAATWQLRAHDSAHLSVGAVHRKLIQHQEFERRLQEMLRQCRYQHDRAERLDDQQRLAKEMTVLEGRLFRCREALGRIERQMERRTR